jgi:hypothetical protein
MRLVGYGSLKGGASVIDKKLQYENLVLILQRGLNFEAANVIDIFCPRFV